MTEKQDTIQAVIFDLGRVLVDIDNRLLVDKLFKGLKATDVQDLARQTMADPAMVAFNCGQMEPEAFYQRMCDSFGLKLDFAAFRKQWCEIFFTMAGMKELVAELSTRVSVGLLSDTDPIHWDFICRRWPWIGHIKNPTLSFEVGVMKPNAPIYQAAADNVNTPPRHCLFIDDLHVNCDGARAIGMQAIRFKGIRQLKHDLTQLNLLAL